jgi:arylsulfatase
MMEDRGLPGYRGHLNEQCVTIAEALKASGYRTAMSGKWHLSNAIITKKQVNHHSKEPFWNEATKRTWPHARGFDSFYGIIIGCVDFFDPFSLTRDDEAIFDPPPVDFYLTDAITEEAVNQLKAGGDKPLFLYVAYTAPHWPLHAKPADIAKYKGRYRDGWMKIREARHKRQIELGIVDPNWQSPPPEPEMAQQQDEDAQRIAVYAAMIDSMDQGIGRILASLEETKQADNTIVMFLSDNGGCHEIPKPNWFDVTTRTRDDQPIGREHGPLGSQRTYESYGPAWAWVSNTPFRRYKHFVHEGGIATPFIMRWPKIVPAGGDDRVPRHVIDVMPTLLGAAAATYPSRRTPLPGVDLLEKPQRDLFWEHEGNRAIRRGDWKLVAQHEQPWELYNLASDRTEMKNLASEHAELVVELANAYEVWAKSVGVVPYEQLPKPIKTTRPATSSSGPSRS